MVGGAEVHSQDTFSSLVHPNGLQFCPLRLLHKANKNVVSGGCLGGAHLT